MEKFLVACNATEIIEVKYTCNTVVFCNAVLQVLSEYESFDHVCEDEVVVVNRDSDDGSRWELYVAFAVDANGEPIEILTRHE